MPDRSDPSNEPMTARPGPTPERPPTRPLRTDEASRSAIGVLAVAAILAMLYLGRAILMPVTLAVVLGFALAPLIRLLRRGGLGHVTSVLAAVLSLGVVLVAVAGIVAVQTVQLASNAELYEDAIRTKAGELRQGSIARLQPAWEAAGRIMSLGQGDSDAFSNHSVASAVSVPPSGVLPVEIRQPPPTASALVQRLLLWLWGPIGTTGIVVIVLIFVLLEQEALRDRFIRLAGGADLRATTTAINDAGERLSRYLLRQFAVNIGVGIVMWAALTALGLPHATLWASLAAGLRFVPYIGMPLTAVFAALFALAVVPGWTLALLTLGAFVVVQTVTSQVIEPRLYGHATGLSPLSVVLATVFWGWLWGPIGVIIATPLTLCLAVAGRHVESLGFLDIVLGDGPALTMSQRFYQRALSGDSLEIIAAAHEFLRRKPFAAYCDAVLMPALALGRADRAAGAITQPQQVQLRDAMVQVVEALGSETRQRARKLPRQSMLDNPSSGRVLREQRLRRQQRTLSGAMTAGAGASAGASIVPCIGLAALGDELATELLVRIVRDMRIDARHVTIADLDAPWPPDVNERSIAAVCIVSVAPGCERDTAIAVAKDVRARLPGTPVIALLMRDLLDTSDDLPIGDTIDRVVDSLQSAAIEIAERVAEQRGTRQAADADQGAAAVAG